MKSMDGLTLLKELKSRWPDMTVIILTAHGTIPDAVRATQAGAFGFLVKPVERDELLGQVQRAVAASTFARTSGDWRANIVARSKLMEDRLAQANSAAAVDAPVLLTGQNGTGKELLARAIHAASPRRDKPFLTVNCPSLEEAQLDHALFGEGGALEKAEGGSLLLEEVGAMPLRVQARLVNEVRLESLVNTAGHAKRSNVRLICTTSCDLKPIMADGNLRQDLYYPLTVMSIEVPPLGRRREDIPLLVSHFLEQATEGEGKKKIYTPKAIELLATTDWPGNVRQLFDLVKQNVALSNGKVITEDQVRESLGNSSSLLSYHEARDQFSREYLTENLQRSHGNVTEAARVAKRHRSDFYTLLTRFRLNANDFKSPGPAVPTRDPAE
jgi:two-component system response regulator GlrR